MLIQYNLIFIYKNSNLLCCFSKLKEIISISEFENIANWIYDYVNYVNNFLILPHIIILSNIFKII